MENFLTNRKMRKRLQFLLISLIIISGFIFIMAEENSANSGDGVVFEKADFKIEEEGGEVILKGFSDSGLSKAAYKTVNLNIPEEWGITKIGEKAFEPGWRSALYEKKLKFKV